MKFEYNLFVGEHMNKALKVRCNKFKTTDPVMPNGDFIESYHSTRQAERETGVDNSSISRCCNGKSLTAGGYVWKYNENAEELIAANLAEEIVG